MNKKKPTSPPRPRQNVPKESSTCLSLEDHSFYYDPAASLSSAHLPLVYVGLHAIARAVGAGHLAVRRWIREEEFPARRCSDGIYRADPEAIRQWFRTNKLTC